MRKQGLTTTAAGWSARIHGRGPPRETDDTMLKRKILNSGFKGAKATFRLWFSGYNGEISGDRELVNFSKEFWPQIPNAHFKFRRADPKTCPAEF